MDIIPFLDTNATGAFNMMANNSTSVFYLKKINIEYLKDMYVIWRNRKNIYDLTKELNIPDHEKKEKMDKIEFFRKAALRNYHTDTTLFAMRIDNNSPIVITDGIHRAIGIYKAYLEDKQIKEKICLRMLLFEGNGIAELDDYKLSIPS